MSKSDNKFVNLSDRYELKDWLYRNDFSKKESNVDELIDIINNKVKQGNTEDNITWDELDAAYEENPEWFENLAAIGE
ncbi:hypothetical protein [Vibrio vulnificus]|uniref:hypothetical protein n=1 Tax=Vibrio vulnificus TaxID=672 RepID=UPI000506E8F9|nr:hypothetical protein [Vibrio vulnificus]EHY1015885.1 hypothetical protein [Vibrio vulnificus]EHY1123532.1 hypothetical protein [Vibrio vulnificus]KFK48189.1 hypothetical protein JS87_22985 [Vibrio vulnificus]KFK52598.1 hypothetical protein JS86_24395 [Vibrio vulnificus]POC05571.1 hypothetical protein CRN54_22820 [Vibrio vulnificus]